MPDFESGPPLPKPMVEYLAPGDTGYDPGKRSMRYKAPDGGSNPVVFNRADTPNIGENGTLKLALQRMMENDQDDGRAETSGDNESGTAPADFPVTVTLDPPLIQQQFPDR